MDTEPRIIPPDEARQEFDALATFLHPTKRERLRRDIAHTAAVLGEQRQAVLDLHRSDADGRCISCYVWSADVPENWPCPTARALGVSGE